MMGNNWVTIAAVCSWCLFAYMVPVAAYIVWRRRRRDKTEVIQQYAAEFDDNEGDD